jgi:NAD(P)-dependent dehydrogenase (short-subunit alcohol dehydrogenase family)
MPDESGTAQQHALVVGGSGMLAGLGRSLAEAEWLVTVVGRDEEKLARATSGERRLEPLSVDYEEVGVFSAALVTAAAARGPIELAVCWIRSWAPDALRAAADVVAPDGRLFHVLGSRGGDASAAMIAELEARERLRYRQVQLGGVATAGGHRWLTNDEISSGVFAAVIADRPFYLVGTAAP